VSTTASQNQAIQRARAIAPGQQAAVLTEALLGAAHHRALLRLTRLEMRLRRRGKTHGGTGTLAPRRAQWRRLGQNNAFFRRQTRRDWDTRENPTRCIRRRQSVFVDSR
jgi:hypothetical protein